MSFEDFKVQGLKYDEDQEAENCSKKADPEKNGAERRGKDQS